MPASAEIVAKVKKYMDQLNREDKIKHALSRLDKIDMTLDLLQKTAVGKAVNGLCSHDTYGGDALRIVTRWKEIARRNGIIPVQKSSSSSSEDEEDDHEADSEDDRSHRRNNRKRSASLSPPPRKAPKIEAKEEPMSPPRPSKSVPSSSSTSAKPPQKVKVIKKEEDDFSRMLASVDTGVARPKKQKSMDWKNEIDLNYRPLPMMNNAKAASSREPEEQFNPELMFKPRNDRLKVFAGKRKVVTLTEVPTLFSSCMRVICNNIDSIEETGDIPFDILRPVFEKCTPQQLAYIESRNSYLEEDSDELWEKFFNKSFPGKRLQRDETHKEAFFRMKRESDDRLKMLSQKISSSMRAEEKTGHRKTMLAADPGLPREVRQRQAKHGLQFSKAPLPSALEVSKARKKIFESGSSKSLAAIPSAVINRTSTVGSKKDSKKPVAKKGALMIKTMKMLNMKRR